jgi:RNA polymerase sigma factor (sigma-70 family)
LPAPDAHGAITAVWRVEAGRLVAALVRLVRDVGRAEELAQDALVAALEHWPRSGIPERPGAWLMAVAKRRALNVLSRAEMIERKFGELERTLATEGDEVAAIDDAIDDHVGDDLLRLVFIACHPELSTPARVALTLRLLGGLTTEEIARAFLVPEPTIAQRIVRAKRTLADKRIPFELPATDELGARLASVLEVVYLIFNEGYAATRGDDVLRPALCDDALRLAGVLVRLAPAEPEVHGLLALMELVAARAAARTDAAGDPVLLLEQDRSRWDRALVERGLATLARAEALGGSRGPYVIQAAIAACHARARLPDHTDWARIAALYGELAELTGSPVVELNRAMAVAMAEGPAAGLVLVDALIATPSLRDYHLLPSARADLLAKLGRFDEARAEFERAAALTRNTRQRDRLRARAAACGSSERS